NSDGRLLTGMTANVDIITGLREDVLRVPVAATRFLPRENDRRRAEEDDDEDGAEEGSTQEAYDPSQTYVWVPGDAPYAPRSVAVETGLEGEDYIEITAGLEPGQEVITRTRSPSGRGDEGGA
ncbi:MAG: hypothetical protein HRT63_12965, partial [Erythrobacter sp.]|nr:hypothetical protein [Erythrobacter sp.]